jgi:hypothetical protein
MESRWSRLRQVWWKLAGLALLEVVLVRWLSEPILTHSVLYYPERQPVVLEPSPALQIAVYGAVGVVIVIPISCLVDMSPHARLGWFPKLRCRR